MNQKNPYEMLNEDKAQNDYYNYDQGYNPNMIDRMNSRNNLSRESAQTLPQAIGFNPHPDPVIGIPVQPAQPNQAYPDYPYPHYEGDGYYNPDHLPIRRRHPPRTKAFIIFVVFIMIAGIITVLVKFLSH